MVSRQQIRGAEVVPKPSVRAASWPPMPRPHWEPCPLKRQYKMRRGHFF